MLLWNFFTLANEFDFDIQKNMDFLDMNYLDTFRLRWIM